MSKQSEQAGLEFRRTMKWIAVMAVLMVAGALVFLHLMGEFTFHAAVATTLGVFFAVLLGCGLFALAFFSDKSGHDDDVTDATRRDEDGRH